MAVLYPLVASVPSPPHCRVLQFMSAGPCRSRPASSNDPPDPRCSSPAVAADSDIPKTVPGRHVVGASNFIIFTPGMTAVRGRCPLRFGQPSPGVGPQPWRAARRRVVASGSRQFTALALEVVAGGLFRHIRQADEVHDGVALRWAKGEIWTADLRSAARREDWAGSRRRSSRHGRARGHAASVVVTTRVWSPKLATRSSRPPSAST